MYEKLEPEISKDGWLQRLTFLFFTGWLICIIIWSLNSFWLMTLSLAVLGLTVTYFTFPLLFCFNPKIQRYFVYQHKSKLPAQIAELKNPRSFGVYGARNFELEVQKGHRLALWHILPNSLVAQSHTKTSEDDFWESSIKDSEKDIIIYLHGNTGTRSLDHRREFYALFQLHGHHVIALDYRGFADSSFVDLNEETTTEDGIFVYNWVLNMFKESKKDVGIILWGHSLGSAIASSIITKLPAPPKGLILEAPFTNISDALRLHRKAKLFRNLHDMLFKWLFVISLNQNMIFYESDRNITKQTDTPVLILHAKDDETVPIELGRQLYSAGFLARLVDGAKPIYMKEFEAGHGHKYICRSPDFMLVVQNFIESL